MKKYLYALIANFFLTVVFIFSSPALFSQVAVDAITTISQNTSPVTWAHTTNGSNRLLVVSVTADNGTVSSITYNGTALTKINDQQDAFSQDAELWYLLNPPSGTYNIVVTHSTNDDIICGGISFINVDQTTPLGTSAKATANNSVPTIAVTTASANEMVVDVVETMSDPLTVGAGQTQRWNLAPVAGFTAGGSSTEPGNGGSVTMSWTTPTSTYWAIVAVPIKYCGTTCSSGPTGGSASLTATPINHGDQAQVNLTGQSGGTTIQWQVSTDNINFTNISGATTTPYTTPAMTGGTYYYRAEVTRTADGCMSYSSTATLVVNNGPCGACTRFISGGTNTTITAGEVVCIKFGDTYTGNAQINGGILCVDSATSIAAGGTFSGRLQSCLTFNNLDEIGCGTMNNHGTVTMATRSILMAGGNINNYKTISFNRLTLDGNVSGSAFTNKSGATLTISDASTGISLTGTPVSSFTNIAGGTVTLSAGDASVTSGTLTNQGTMSVTGALTVSGASASLNNSGIFTVSDGDFTLNDATATNSGTLSITKALADFNLQSGTGSFTSSGIFSVNDRIDLSIGGTFFTNSGTASANHLYASTDVTFANNSPGAMTLTLFLDATQGTSFTNSGTITTGTYLSVTQQPITTSGSITVGTDFTMTQGPLDNSGNILVNRDADFSQGGPHINTGCIAVKRDFTHSQSTFNGPAVGTGRFCVGGVTTGSSGTFGGTGNLDMCDNGSPPGGWDSKSIYTDNGTHCGVSYASCSNCNTILPVELISFTASCENNSIPITWETATETNNDYFSVERSVNGIHFEEIGKVNGAGNSSTFRSYKYIDYSENWNYETIYYRLRQTGFDGKYESFAPVAVTPNCGNGISIFPSVSEGVVDILSKNKLSAPISVIDATGKKVYSENDSERWVKKSIDLRNLSSGIYTVIITTEKENIVQKIIINK